MAIAQLLKNKDARGRAQIKGQVIANAVSKGKVTRSEYEIEIVDIEPIEGGVQVFARAWKNGKQIGFGKDGTVDIERFIIINPPVLVDDPNGDIIKERGINEITGEKRPDRILREDPQEALLQVLEHTLSVMKNIHGDEAIVRGKRGNTTSTFYADAGGDGVANQGNNNWTTAREAATASSVNKTEASNFIMGDFENPAYNIRRGFFPFDTSSIGSDVVSSATFSLYQVGAGEGTRDFGLIQTTQASLTDLVAGDYDALTLNSPDEGTDARVSCTTAGAYKDFVMNATGLGWIDTGGNTLLGVRHARDIDNSTPTARDYAEFSNSDNTGTSQDPKLVVEHSASGGATPTPTLLTLGVG